MGYEQSAGKLSQMEIDADLIMGAHNITLGALQTVDGIDVGKVKIKNLASSSGVVRKSVNPSALTSTSVPLELVGTVITIPWYYASGTFKVGFKLNGSDGADTHYGKIFKNGAEFGAEQEHIGNSWSAEIPQDLTLAGGDTVQIAIRKGTDTTVYTKELKIYCDETVAIDTEAW